MNHQIKPLTMQQCIDMAVQGFVEIDDKKLFRISKHLYRKEAQKACKPNEIIYANHILHFVLSEIRPNLEVKPLKIL